MKPKLYLKIFICNFLILIINKATIAQNWTAVNVGLNADINCVEYPNSSTIFMASIDGITKSFDGGNTWNTIPYLDNLGDTIYDVEFYDLHFFDDYIGVATGVLAGGNTEIIYQTFDGGQSWSVVSTYSQGNLPRVLNDLEFISSTVGFACGTNGRILKTTDGGATWNPAFSNTTVELHSISFATSLNGTAVGNNVILRTTDGGATWMPTAVPNYLLKKVQYSGNSIGYAVGNSILKTTNGGNNWTEISTLDATDIFVINSDTLFICNTNLLKTVNQGQFWGAQVSVPIGQYNDICFLNELEGYLVGNNGQVYHTATGGEAFAVIDVGVDLITPTNITNCSLPTEVKARLKNFGTGTINSVDIHWSLNGVAQNVVNWTGNLVSNALSSLISLGNVAFTGNDIDIKVWTALPNGLIDPNFSNDTLIDTLTTNLLFGTYTIGGVNPDFINFNSAVASLNNAQICGDVVFNIRDGVYNEFLIFNNVNTLNNGTVTFQSESGDSAAVTLSNNAEIVVKMYNSKNIHFKKITVNSDYDSNFDITSNCNFISVKNCSLNCLNNFIIRTANSNVIIENNLFNGANGIYPLGNYVVENLLIANNIFNVKQFAINVVGVKNVIIRGNTINMNPLSNNFTAIELNSGMGNCEVSANKRI